MGIIEKESDLEPLIDGVCKKIVSVESEEMEGGTETVGDFGFKCAKAAFKAAMDICQSAYRIKTAIEGE